MSRNILRELIRLGWPVLVAQVAVMLYGVIDTIMAGRFSTTDLAAVGIGASIYVSVFVTLMGVLLALAPTASQLFGAGRLDEIGEEVRQTVWLGLGLAGLSLVLLRFPEPFFAITQTAPEVEAKTRAYLQAIAWGVPALLLFRVFNSFSTAISLPRVVMVLNLAGLALKVPLNWVLMYGHFGAPPLGSTGCAIATALIGWVSCIGGWVYCYYSADYRRFGVFARWSWPSPRRLAHLLGVGLPIGATFMVDVTAFTFMTLFIARLGTLYSGAHQIAANFAALLFMLPLALGNAAGVLVGQALGARDFARARATGLTAIGIALLVAVVICVSLYLLRGQVAGFYTADVNVQTIATRLLGLVALYHVADALQAIAVNVLRGYKRTFVPMLIYTGALWGVGLAGGYLLAFGAAQLGAAGFWVAAIASLVVAGGLVTLYFLAISREGVVRPAISVRPA